MHRRWLIAGLALMVGLSLTALVRADAQAAKDYVKQAQDLVDGHDNEGAAGKLELAEAELDGVDDATKAPIVASIQSIRKSIAAANASADAQKYHRKLQNLMSDAEGSIGNQVTWPGAESAINELFADPAAQAAIPDEIAAAKKKFATYKKLSDKKLAVAVGGEVDNAMKELDAKWAENKPKFTDPNAAPNDKSSAADDMTRAMDETRKQIARLPADSDAAKADTARVDRINAEFTQIALADQAKDVAARLKDDFDSYKNEYEGWDKETEPGPSWSDYQHMQNDKISAFNAPKSKAFIARANYFLSNLVTNEDYKAVAAAAAVKVYVDQVKADLNKAYAQMLHHAKPLVDSALASGGEALSKLKDDVRLALGESSPEGKAMQDAIQKKIDGVANAANAASDAQTAWYKQMTQNAAAAWPGISSKFKAVDGFDPNNYSKFKGKIIKITTDNLMGYRFKPGDFEFATTLSGMPIAAHFDPALKSALSAVETKLGRSLGDSDDDGKWEIYAVVTGKKGRMMQKKESEGDVKVDGQSVGTVTANYADPVDAPIITIVAAHCGPFVGGKSVGVIQTDGTIK